jgi:hypothetical protein
MTKINSLIYLLLYLLIGNFLNGEIAIYMPVYPLPDDEKFLRYDFFITNEIDARQ